MAVIAEEKPWKLVSIVAVLVQAPSLDGAFPGILPLSYGHEVSKNGNLVLQQL